MSIEPINQSLGKLEQEVMEITWRLGKASVRQVLTQLRKKRPIAYTTVMTVMARLAAKDLLKRKLDDNGAYLYQPICDKRQYCKLASKKAITGLIKAYGEIAVAQFVEAVESSSLKDLENWQLKLKRIK